ncbi:MAG: hypothetical protein WBP41_08995 [Saprospiraceae bacterium]
MITVIQLFHELSNQNCMSCNSRGIHDMSQSDVFIDCHFAGQGDIARFVVTVTTLQGACLINGTYNCNDTIEVTLTTGVLCYDPCAEEQYYDQYENCEN